MNRLYLSSGYLNQRWVEEQADKHNISFIIEIGGRQVGKTFGTLQLMLQEDKRFILMRRTSTETDFICTDVNNPFTIFEEFNISLKKDSKYSASIYSNSEESDPQFIGSVMALSTVAKIRGFNGSIYTDLVFDEFIPENHVIKIKDEGDAFLNAVVTISGAREENGKKPLRVWLLANPNTISNPILQALNVSVKVEEMKLNGQEYSIMEDRGIMIILPKSEEILNKRKQNALFKAIGGANRFTGMALDNEFSYNDSSDVAHVNINDFKLSIVYDNIGIYMHKSKDVLYCTNYIRGSVKAERIYQDTEKDKIKITRDFPALRSYYIHKRMFFSDLTVKSRIVDIIL